jgi:hypothetical protein
MAFLDFLLGKPLASDEGRNEQIGGFAGIPVFGLDALGSAAYGPEAALTILIPLGAAGIVYIVPLSFSIIVLWWLCPSKSGIGFRSGRFAMRSPFLRMCLPCM